MSTTSNNNNPYSQTPKDKKLSRSTLIAAVAGGAITVEAANLLLQHYEPGVEPITESQVTEYTISAAKAPETTDNTSHTETVTSNTETEQNPTEHKEEPTPHNIREPKPEPIEPKPEPIEPKPQPIEPKPQPLEPGDNHDNVVDAIVEEIDPHDLNTVDVLNIDRIGKIYTPEGHAINAAWVHTSGNTHAVMIDLNGDNVYDIFSTPEGEFAGFVEGDIDTSDVQMLYAQQHGDNGYMRPDQFDIAMQKENSEMDGDIILT